MSLKYRAQRHDRTINVTTNNGTAKFDPPYRTVTIYNIYIGQFIRVSKDIRE